MEWFYERDGQPVGPVAEEALRELVRNGTVRMDCRVWCAAFGQEWKLLSSVPEFQSTTPPALNADLHPDTPNRNLTARAREVLSGKWGTSIFALIIYGVVLATISWAIGFPLQRLYMHLLTQGVFSNFFTITNGVPSPKFAFFAINYAVGIIQNFFIMLPTAALVVGFMSFFLGMARRNNPGVDSLFKFYPKHFIRCFLTNFMMTFFIYLWSLLFIIPGIVAGYSYSQTFYILADNPELKPLEAIAKSKRMMRGYRWKLFCLHWRFFGWSLLCLLTCGIGFFWLIPYIMTSLACFYESVKSRA